MGRTVMAFSQVMEAERERLRPFRRALSKEDQEAFDRLFDRAKLHTSAGVLYVQSLADGYYPSVHLPGTREDDRGDSGVDQRKEGLKNRGIHHLFESVKGN